MDLNGWDEEGYRRRIRLMRRVLGMNQTQFADHVGIGYKKWNHYECGYPISRETAFLLREKLDWFSADWLWHGDTRALPGGIVSQLQQAEMDERKHRRIKPGKPLPQTEVRKKIPRTINKR